MNIIYLSIIETIIIIIAGLIVAIGFSYFLEYLTRENDKINEEYLEKKGK
jgi:biopolymer transport protein ExbB/TolQ